MPKSESSFIQSPVAWRKRVFRNTFTRGGKRIAVKGWSVKIQHQGIRRTLPLAAASRDAAALEAQALYQTIVAQGWQAAESSLVPRPNVSREARSKTGNELHWPKTDVRYWQQRLLLRRHSASESQTVTELSTRIEHAGGSAYFPLGTSDQPAAAAKALEIYQTIVEEGWGDACERFSRELTIGVHWAGNPLGWTYATLHSQPLLSSRAVLRREVPVPPRWKIALIEPDTGIRRSLVEVLNHHVDCTCDSSFAYLDAALREIPRRPPHLALVSQHLTNLPVAESLQSLRSLSPELPILLYSVHEDSEQLFKATPGGAAGYLLKRTAPEQLLAPLELIPPAPTLRSEQVASSIRRYFQSVIESWPTEDSASVLAKLTHREEQVLNLMTKGHVDKEIAQALGISVWTVHGHVKNIFDKFGVHSRTEAVVKYLHK